MWLKLMGEAEKVKGESDRNQGTPRVNSQAFTKWRALVFGQNLFKTDIQLN